MNRKRLGQLLIGGVFAVCGLVIAALTELVAKEEQKPENGETEAKDERFKEESSNAANPHTRAGI